VARNPLTLAAPVFKPTTSPGTPSNALSIPIGEAPKMLETRRSEQTAQPTQRQKREMTPKVQNMLWQDLRDLTINKQFTPSTPYVHKFRTELCKNFELTGTCKFGDEVSLLII